MRRASFIVLFFLFVSTCHSTIYYIRDIDGDNADDGLTLGNAWLTLQYALDQALSPGDELRAFGTFSLTATLDNDVNSGDSTQSGGVIILTGANGSGVVDGTKAILDGSGIVSGNIFSPGSGVDFWYYKYLTFSDAPAGSGLFLGASGHTAHYFFGCNFTSNNAWGAFVASFSNSLHFSFCEFDNNADGAFLSGSIGPISDCTIRDNAGIGLQDPQQNVLNSRLLVYGNGGVGISADTNAYYGGGTFLQDSIIYNNGGDGLFIGSMSDGNTFAGTSGIKGLILAENGGYGLNIVTAGIQDIINISEINSFGNVSGHCNYNGGVIPGDNIITTDPDFVNVGSGTEDFTPQNNDLAVPVVYPAGGTTYKWIGAIQPAPGGGGGGGDKWPFRGMKRIGY